MPKAQLLDAQVGRTLWMKDHGTWLPVIVEDVTYGGKGPKVTFRHPDGTVGKRSLDALYVTPPHRPGT